jgi:hypothetical protein
MEEKLENTEATIASQIPNSSSSTGRCFDYQSMESHKEVTSTAV